MVDALATDRAALQDDRRLRMVSNVVFATLFLSYAFFWHARDWNASSRLMLVYALGDRGTIKLNGLETQTRDLAFFAGSFYTDKQPGYSFLALPIYGAIKIAFRLPSHPLDAPAMTHWPADYWLTLLTSGVATALGAILLMHAARSLGCRPRTGALVALSYGLGTPAYVYATLAYGHQVTAITLFAAFLLAMREPEATGSREGFFAGLLASLAVSVELSAAPVSALVGVIAIVRVLKGEWSASALAAFALGAAGPIAGLLAYNRSAFGSPFDVGYVHHVVPRFRALHGRGNPLGLRAPRFDRLVPLLWGQYRGLLVYAPAVVLAPVGWLVMAARRQWTVLAGTLGACVLVLMVNLSYPEWTGGWSTGPRLLVTLLPFAMLATSAALTVDRLRVPVLIAFACLSLFGAAVNLGCQGVGGRLPDTLGTAPLDQPLTRVVVPFWKGEPIPRWWTRDTDGRAQRFARTVVSVLRPDVARLGSRWQWMQFVPLVIVQLGGVGLLFWATRKKPQAAPGRSAAS